MPTLRTRRLPHYRAVNRPTFLTWRLYGSPAEGRVFPVATTSGKAFVAMDRWLDAKMVVETIDRHAQSLSHCRLHNFVVMANHVHLLITPQVPVSKLMQSLKRFTAREGNRILGVPGQPSWQEERIASYIEMNPVLAGLVAAPEDDPWSSAGRIDNLQQVANLPHNPQVSTF